MTTLKYAEGITEHRVTLAQQAGSLLYTVFKMVAWTVGLGASAFATLFHMLGIPELIGGAIRVAAGSAVVYLAVTLIVNRLFGPVPVSSARRPKVPHSAA